MTVEATGVPHVTYLLKSSSDLKVWDDGVEIKADRTGLLSLEMQGMPKAKFFCFVYEPSE
jgi:hypothetical protein